MRTPSNSKTKGVGGEKIVNSSEKRGRQEKKGEWVSEGEKSFPKHSVPHYRYLPTYIPPPSYPNFAIIWHLP